MTTVNTRTMYTVGFRIAAVQRYLALPDGPRGKTGTTSLAVELGVSVPSLNKWVMDYRNGVLSLSNAVSVARKPDNVVTGDIYHVSGRDFRTKDEAIRYAVELAGGITVTRTIHESVTF